MVMQQWESMLYPNPWVMVTESTNSTLQTQHEWCQTIPTPANPPCNPKYIQIKYTLSLNSILSSWGLDIANDSLHYSINSGIWSTANSVHSTVGFNFSHSFSIAYAVNPLPQPRSNIVSLCWA